MRNKPVSISYPELGSDWQDWLAGKREALGRLAARAADAALARPVRAAFAAAALLAEQQAAQHFALRAPLAAQLGELVDELPVRSEIRVSELATLAAASLLESYGEWPCTARIDAPTLRAAVARLLGTGRVQLAQARGDSDLLLLACCGLGEWCEREGRETEFEQVAVAATLREGAAPVAAWSRLHWRVVVAWHCWALGRRDDARHALAEARQIADGAGLADGATLVELQTARLVSSGTDPAAARAAAARVRAQADPARCPLWLADAADAEARAALAAGDYRGAVVKSRQALAWLAAAGASASYALTYRIREVSALSGLGELQAAAEGIAAIDAMPLPPFLASRVRVLTGLLALLPQDREDRWGRAEDARLAELLHGLSQLAWPTILNLLPAAMARLFARGLQAGCQTEWLQQAIRAHRLDPPQTGGAARPRQWPWAVRLRILGPFECETAAPLAAAGVKAPAKPMALLRLIALHEADGSVAAATVAQALWPGEGREGRDKALETTLARLRKLLGHADAVLLHEHRLRLNPARVWCDWPALLQRLDRVEAAPRDRVGPGWEEVFALWRGPLLGDEPDDAAWLYPWRERLRNRLAAALLASAAAPGHAARCLRAFSLDPQLEARMRGPAQT